MPGTAITLSSFTKPNEDVFRVCMIVALSNSCAHPPYELLCSAMRPMRCDGHGVLLSASSDGRCFSICGGFAIFAVLGSLAHSTGQTVEDVAKHSGTGLAFISIAEGCAISFGDAANAVAVPPAPRAPLHARADACAHS